MDLFYLLSPLLGIVMRGLYFVVSNYGWAIILFTFLVRILMFPLSMKQQKSQARTSAYQPMIKEIQKKWANDRNKQNEEVQKFQQENGIKMSAGCLPMVINMLVLFGVIGVIQSPLQHILSIPQGELAAGYSIVNYHHPESNVLADTYTQQTILIDEIKANPELFIEGVDVVETLPQSDSTPSSAAQSAASGSASGSVSASGAGGDAGTPPGTTVHYAMSQESIDAIQKFDFTLNLFGWKIDLATAPDFGNFWTLVMPILSLLTMFGSQAIIMLFGGTGQQQGKVSMIVMTVIMGVMFAFFAFRVPLGFSLYYTVSNVVMTIQQLVLRKIYDPAKIREQVEAEIEAKRQEKKAKKKVTIKNDAGEVLDLDVPESELVRMRLQRARELDAEKYGELDAEAEARLAEARRQDEAKYAAAQKQIEAGDAAMPKDAEDAAKPQETAKPAEARAPEKANESAQADAHKPGRRKRARQKKTDEETSFVKDEKVAENRADASAEDKEGKT